MMYVHKFDILHNKCGTKYGKQGIKLLRRQIEQERESQKMKQLAINNASLGVLLTSITTNSKNRNSSKLRNNLPRGSENHHTMLHSLHIVTN